MIPLRLAEVADLVSGRLCAADGDAVVSAPVEFDSRKVTPGSLFLALPGERADGHDFAAEAVVHGAVAALVTRPVPVPRIEVADGHAALADLARAVAGRLPDTTVVGVTGSSGKTSTKDLLAAVLAHLGPTVAPPGSFNNELGHPYTVLLADERTRYLVLETSARGIGHIRYLTGIAPPRIGVVLNVGSAHLGEFGSREAIARAKGELVEALPAAADGGVAVLNADDPLVAAMAERTAARVVTTGRGAGADVRALDVTLDDRGRARFDLAARDAREPVALTLIGEHHVGNALATAAVALECGLSPADTAAALSAARAASPWRMEPTERADGVLILNDAYNANPESVLAALRALAEVGRHRSGRTIAVLGHMAELGPAEVEAHRTVGAWCAELGIDEVLVVGEPARPILDGAGPAGRWVADVAAAVASLRSDLRAGDVVLVKASHSASLERVALAIGEDRASDPGTEEPTA